MEEESQHQELYWQIQSYYDSCVGKAYKKAMNEGFTFDPSSEDSYKLVKKVFLNIEIKAKTVGVCDDFDGYTFEQFKAYSNIDFERFYSNSRNHIKLPESERPIFEMAFYNYIISQTAISAYTGLVFTGYGENDIYPVLIPIKISSFIETIIWCH